MRNHLFLMFQLLRSLHFLLVTASDAVHPAWFLACEAQAKKATNIKDASYGEPACLGIACIKMHFTLDATISFSRNPMADPMNTHRRVDLSTLTSSCVAVSSPTCDKASAL